MKKHIAIIALALASVIGGCSKQPAAADVAEVAEDVSEDAEDVPADVTPAAADVPEDVSVVKG